MEIIYETKTVFLLGIVFIIGLVTGMTLATRKQINLLDLVVGKDGKLSAARLWENIALAVGVWAFVYSVYTRIITEAIWLIFLASYTGNKLLGNLIHAKYTGNSESNKNDSSSA